MTRREKEALLKKELFCVVKDLRDFHDKNIAQYRTEKIYLGRTFSLGVKFQCLLAERLFSSDKYKKHKVLVDCAISAKGVKTFYPDILLVSPDGKLLAVFDVKLDGGFLNENSMSQKSASFLQYKNFFKATEFFYLKRDKLNRKEEKKTRIEIPGGNKVHRFVVMLDRSAQNKKKNSKAYEGNMKKLGFKVFSILRDKKNDYRDGYTKVFLRQAKEDIETSIPPKGLSDFA